jgi:prepilin-type N-terminal cleavage/methylation domain-containing protein
MKISLRRRQFSSNEANFQPLAPRKGFVIVEVIVAMVLLAVAVTSLAALLYSISQSGMVATGNAYRNGVLMNEVNRLVALPYDSLAVGSASLSVSTAPYPHTRNITIAEPVPTYFKTVTVVITPTNAKYKPDTANFTRTNARTSKALCTVCT